MERKHMKKGFTLIELLAVIVIIAVVTTITVPLVSDNIKESKKQSFLIGLEHVMTAMKDDQAKQDFIALEYSFPLSASTTLEVDGDTTTWRGTAKITEEGNIELLIHNGTFCASKKLSESDITLQKMSYKTCINQK